jgi:hypothetical protein
MNCIHRHPVFRFHLRTFATLGIFSVMVSGGSFLQAGEPLRLDDRVPVEVEALSDDSLFNRDTLLGDWGGLRPSLGEKGITWDLSFTSVYAGVNWGQRKVPE